MQHSHWVLITVFFVAMVESLAAVGLVVPGVVVMIGAGALIALGTMDFWPTFFAAVLGAVVGDGLSYWLGFYFRDRLRTAWPFCRHPEWLSHGEKFFIRHGGKSVVFGRFVGPIRAIIPVVAGMFGMRPATFYLVNVLSAFAWAPVYLLLGMAFGTSLAVAGEVAGRLAMMLLLLVSLIWFVFWFTRWLFQVLSPRTEEISQRLLAWGRCHPYIYKIMGGILDPSHPEAKSLMIMGALLIAATWLFLGVLEDVITGDPLVRVDQGLYQFMQDLRTPWGDRIMVFITELGDGVVVALVAVAVLIWLLWHRNWQTAAYWVAAVGFGQLAAGIIKLTMHRPRPVEGLYEGFSTYSFPSGHATMSVVTYGFLAILVALQLPQPRRWFIYALATMLIFAIAISRIYLGAHWLSDVLGGLSLGFAWVSMLGIAYYRHRPLPFSNPSHLAGVTLLTLVLASTWHVYESYTKDMQRYAPRMVVQYMEAKTWWQESWQQLPAYRIDLEGEFEQPLNIQWGGTLASLCEKLRALGWHDAVPLRISTALQWLNTNAEIEELPVLPQVHDGRNEVLLLLGPQEESRVSAQATANKKQQLVLRLWKSGIVLNSITVPLWVGNVSFQEQKRILFLTLPVTTPEFDLPLEKLMMSLNGMEQRTVRHPLGAAEMKSSWSGSVLLIRDE